MPARDLESIYADFSRMVYWTAFGVLRNEHDSMDVAQNVFVRSIPHMHKLERMNDAQLRGWLYRVTVNLCMDHKRSGKREVILEELPEAADENEADLPESSLLSKEQRLAVREAIEALPDIYRETVILHYFSGLAYDEIARLSGVSEGTVKSRMSRARARLLSLLKEGETHGE